MGLKSDVNSLESKPKHRFITWPFILSQTTYIVCKILQRSWMLIVLNFIVNWTKVTFANTDWALFSQFESFSRSNWYTSKMYNFGISWFICCFTVTSISTYPSGPIHVALTATKNLAMNWASVVCRIQRQRIATLSNTIIVGNKTPTELVHYLCLWLHNLILVYSFEYYW